MQQQLWVLTMTTLGRLYAITTDMEPMGCGIDAKIRVLSNLAVC